MSKSNTFENDVLRLIFNAVAIANIGDNTVTAPLTNLFVALHTADPGEAGDQSTFEANYTGYARVAVARSAGGWTVTGNAVSPVANIGFPACTAGANTVTHFSIGVASAGATKILYRGALGSGLGPFTATVADTLTLPGLTGLAVNDRIAFAAVNASALPAGITEGVLYWVLTLSGDSITVSSTQAGPTLDITASGDGVAFRATPLAISSGVTPSLTTAMTITED